VLAASLGALDFVEPEEFAAVEAVTPVKIRAQLTWDYFARIERRWDHQPPFGIGALG
jgi:hypothetical protein